ncbi:YlbF family regulator [Bacillus sp. 165]|uniref:YlbF family regulator n=1 Tax=Bacillus sp. 165 TaxID=1529117 RepID=UPI001ADB5D93|nr:YlbF family regulator [Bacillus sp. 165]MBO9128747.1 YlbF family regulator [Bacillus sp. 165]
MATNMYDAAYDLQKAITENPDYQALKTSYQQVQTDPQAKQLFEQFRAVQMELQQKMMQGQEITEQDNMKAQQIVVQVQQNPKISQLMQAEQRMNMLITDLNKIILKPLEELYGPMQQ